MEKDNKIDQLSEHLEAIIAKQEDFIKEIMTLRKEIRILKGETLKAEVTETKKVKPEIQNFRDKAKVKKARKAKFSKLRNSNIEKFIGENLISKIGIAIIVIGVALGAKYAIDKQMLGPLGRITIAYLFGFGLLALALKLKKAYTNYSSVLLSGSFAILYFVSYAAYSYYAFFSQAVTFILMLIFTTATVYSALKYNRQIIAHFGLVGAYTIPFLLSDGSGKVLILFSYMLILNFGILYLSFKKYWKPLYYSSFMVTWLVLILWLLKKYDFHTQFTLAYVFVSLFFLLFYLAFLSYKLIQNEKFNLSDIFLLLFNAFIFYGLSYGLLQDFESTKKYLGLFTLVNALVHAGISLLIYKRKLADKNLFYFVLGLALVFLSITIPVQLSGNWITMLWAGEAALFYWIARSKQVSLYEKLAFPLAFLAFFSLLHDWSQVYDHLASQLPENYLFPFINIHFFTSLFVAASLGLIIYLNKYQSPLKTNNASYKWIFKHSTTVLLLIVLYFAFWTEISNYWTQLFESTKVIAKSSFQNYKSYIYNYDLEEFKAIWIYNFSILYLIVFTLLNYFKFRKKGLAQIAILANIILLFSFLTQGLISLSELTKAYVNPINPHIFAPNRMYIFIRYISIILVSGLIFSTWLNIKSGFMQAEQKLFNIFHLLLHIIIIWILSSELLNLTTLFHLQHADKLGLSILWGIYAVFLIILGIQQNKKTLRILAIILFGITLVKLFVYDISYLSMLSKTFVFVILGALLLVISFLYTKYKELIFKDDEKLKTEETPKK